MSICTIDAANIHGDAHIYIKSLNIINPPLCYQMFHEG